MGNPAVKSGGAEIGINCRLGGCRIGHTATPPLCSSVCPPPTRARPCSSCFTLDATSCTASAALYAVAWISKPSSMTSGKGSRIASPTTVKPSTGWRIPSGMGVICFSSKDWLLKVGLDCPYRDDRGTGLVFSVFLPLMRMRSGRSQRALVPQTGRRTVRFALGMRKPALATLAGSGEQETQPAAGTAEPAAAEEPAGSVEDSAEATAESAE